jgi:hypothetical protein
MAAEVVRVDDVLDRANEYGVYAAARDRAHYQMSLKLDRRSRFLGVPSIILGALVGTAIFGALESAPSTGWKIATGLTSIAAAVLAALQTFFNYADLAAKHAQSSNVFAGLRRDFHAFRLRNSDGAASRDQALDELKELNRRLAEAEQVCPRIPNRQWKKAYSHAKAHDA